MKSSIGYHTRSCKDHTIKITGGSFGGQIDMETVNRLVNAHFAVKEMPSGRLAFVDRQDREVTLYLSVDPETTEKGKAAIVEIRKRKEQERQKEIEKQDEIERLLGELSTDEILERLRK